MRLHGAGMTWTWAWTKTVNPHHHSEPAPTMACAFAVKKTSGGAGGDDEAGAWGDDLDLGLEDVVLPSASKSGPTTARGTPAAPCAPLSALIPMESAGVCVRVCVCVFLQQKRMGLLPPLKASAARRHGFPIRPALRTTSLLGPSRPPCSC